MPVTVPMVVGCRTCLRSQAHYTPEELITPTAVPQRRHPGSVYGRGVEPSRMMPSNPGTREGRIRCSERLTLSVGAGLADPGSQRGLRNERNLKSFLVPGEQTNNCAMGCLSGSLPMEDQFITKSFLVSEKGGLSSRTPATARTLYVGI